MNNFFYLFIPAIPVILCSAFILIRTGIEHGFFEWDWFLLLGIGALLIMSSLCISLVWDTNHVYGVIHATATYLPVIGFILELAEKNRKWMFLVAARVYMVLWGLIISIISFGIALPVSVIPSIRTYPVPVSEIQEKLELDTAFVAESLGKIKQSFVSAQERIEKEKTKIDQSAERLLASLEAKNTELRNLESEQNKLRTEVAYYKELVSMTEPQVEAIRNMLGRGRYVNYILGFIIGVTSSVTAYGIVKVGPRLKFLFTNVDKEERRQKEN